MRKQILALIKELRRCAKQNEIDVKPYDPWENDVVGARAVASEQRRMIKILRTILKPAKRRAT